MKVKIQQRSVYHKFAEIEIEVPDTITENSIQDYLEDIEYIDEQLDEAISKAEYEYGFGCDYDANQNNNSAMCNIEEEAEYRYQCDKLKTGGHL